MSFQPYEHIENHYNTQKEFGNPAHYLFTDEDFMWCAMEKIHGCNFSFITDGNTTTVGRRSGILNPEDNFYNYPAIKAKYEQSAISLFNHITQIIIPIATTIQIYGELFGGHYNNIASKTHKAVQNGMNYHPEHEFMFFDVKVHDADGKTTYLDKATLIEIAKRGESIGIAFKLAPIVKIDNLNAIMELNPKFITLVPAEYGLPPMQNNYSEGFVVHPLHERDNHGHRGCHRTIFKFKNPDFAEIGKGVKSVKTEKYGDVIRDKFINKNRYDNVVSKMLETEKTEENIINALVADVEQEIVDGKEMEINHNAIKGVATGFVKRILHNPQSIAPHISETGTSFNFVQILNNILSEPITEPKQFRLSKENMQTMVLPENAISLLTSEEQTFYSTLQEKSPKMALHNIINYLCEKSNKQKDEPNIYTLLFDAKIKSYRITKEKKFKCCTCKTKSTDPCVCGMEHFVAQTSLINYTSCGRWKKSLYFHEPVDLFNYILNVENEYKTNYDFVEVPTDFFMLYVDLDFKAINNITNEDREICVQNVLQIMQNVVVCNVDGCFQYIYSQKNIAGSGSEAINATRGGVHLYFPRLITDIGHLKRILNYIKANIDEGFKSAIDICAFNGLRVMFQTENHYGVDANISTFPVDGLGKMELLSLTKLRTAETCCNFSLEM